VTYFGIVCFVIRDVDVKLFYYLYPDIDISNYETDYTKLRHDFWSRGAVLDFSKMAVSLKWILDYFVGYTL
jgi:hypothetical protein